MFLVGTSNEIFNQVQSFFDVFMLRLVSNIYPVMKDTTIKGIASTAGLFAFVVYIAFYSCGIIYRYYIIS